MYEKWKLLVLYKSNACIMRAYTICHVYCLPTLQCLPPNTPTAHVYMPTINFSCCPHNSGKMVVALCIYSQSQNYTGLYTQCESNEVTLQVGILMSISFTLAMIQYVHVILGYISNELNMSISDTVIISYETVCLCDTILAMIQYVCDAKLAIN